MSSGRHARARRNLLGLPLAVAAFALGAPAQASAVFSNGIYQARVQGEGTSLGSWAAATDTGHPVGADSDLMFIESAGTIFTETNFSSLRIYEGNGGSTDYTFRGRGGSNDLDDFFTGENPSPFGTSGVRSTWNVRAEALSIIQDVVIVGTTFADSAIYHTVEIVNAGSVARDIGWRNLYDWQVDDPDTDDGPNNTVETTSGAVVGTTTFEFSHAPAAGEFVRVSIDPGTASYEPLLAIGFDPGLIPSLPVTIPDEYAYASWPQSVGTSFDYTIDPTQDVTGDSAGLSWFGRTADTAITVGAGDSVRLTQVLFGVPPGTSPPQIPAPEPHTLALLAGSLGILAALRRRRSRG